MILLTLLLHALTGRQYRPAAVKIETGIKKPRQHRPHDWTPCGDFFVLM